MGRPSSTEVRERVLRACEVGEASQGALARRFEISESAVGSWLRHLRQEGRRAPKPHGRGFRSILDEEDAAVLRLLVHAKNDVTLAEYAQAFTVKTGEELSGSSISRALKRHGLVVKQRHCEPASNRDQTSPPTVRPMPKTWPRSIRTAVSSWMRPEF